MSLYALLLGCAAPALPEAPLPEAAVAEGVVAGGTQPGLQWGLSAAAVELAAGATVAQASAPVVVVQGAGEPISIRSLRSTWQMKERRAHFEGDVVMVRGRMELRCTALDVAYGASGSMERMEAAGPVEVIQQTDSGERRARGARAVYDAVKGEIVLTGSPELQEGGNRLRGRIVRVRMDAEEVICEGGDGEVCVLELSGI